MVEQKFRTDRFLEALGEEVDSAFKRLVSEIMREGALSAKDKALIALAASVAVKMRSMYKNVIKRWR